jgi:putative cardiolipin synthase
MLALAVIGGCASIPDDYDKQESYALTDTSETTLGRQVTELSDPHPGKSGFQLMQDGSDALAARLLLADRAEASIDAQYYYIARDPVGKLFLGRLMLAADRGVRVRLLMDDLYTEGYEQLLAGLSGHPNIEVRLTNPFAYRQARGANFISDLERVNHRMHNKSVTFDNAVTVFGGRNMAAEYFGASEAFNFRDIDTIGLGQIARDVSREFDTYWNAAESLPAVAFVEADASEQARQDLLGEYETTLASVADTPYGAALREARVELLLDGMGSDLQWATATLAYDLPYGGRTPEGEAGPTMLAKDIRRVVERAESEFFLVSPYFVVGDDGVEFFRTLRSRSVRVVVVTNSLASNDVAVVYGGYSKYRTQLLELGVELWEVMAYPLKAGDEKGLASERRGLHAKTFAIDRQRLFIGSFNWDPRSAGINTEMGAIIESTELASSLVESTLAALPYDAWQVRLNAAGEVEWLALGGTQEEVFNEPPQADTAMKIKAEAAASEFVEKQL